LHLQQACCIINLMNDDSPEFSGSPLDRLGVAIFPIGYDEAADEAFIDEERLPEFDTSIFSGEQVVMILREAIPGLYKSTKAAEYRISGRPIAERPADLDDSEESDELYEILLDSVARFSRTAGIYSIGMIQLLDKFAPLNDDPADIDGFHLGWIIWTNYHLKAQHSPLLSDGDPGDVQAQIDMQKRIERLVLEYIDEQFGELENDDDDDMERPIPPDDPV